MKDELTTWLGEQVALVEPGGQLAIKDPRAFWVHDLWDAVATELGIDLSYLTMLRHPAEVVQSRETHYLSNQTDDFRRTRQTANLAGWVNGALETELATRTRPRTFVRYADLLEDAAIRDDARPGADRHHLQRRPRHDRTPSRRRLHRRHAAPRPHHLGRRGHPA